MQPGQSGLQARPLIFNNLQTVSRLSNGLSDIVGTESIGSSSPRPPHQSILAKGDHYLLIFWRQNPFRGTPRMWRPLCSCRSRCHQLLFTYVPLFRQQGPHETRAAGTNRQIHSVPEPARSTHFAVPFPASVPASRLPSAFFQTSESVARVLATSLIG